MTPAANGCQVVYLRSWRWQPRVARAWAVCAVGQPNSSLRDRLNLGWFGRSNSASLTLNKRYPEQLSRIFPFSFFRFGNQNVSITRNVRAGGRSVSSWTDSKPSAIREHQRPPNVHLIDEDRTTKGTGFYYKRLEILHARSFSAHISMHMCTYIF